MSFADFDVRSRCGELLLLLKMGRVPRFHARRAQDIESWGSHDRARGPVAGAGSDGSRRVLDIRITVILLLILNYQNLWG